MQALKNLNPHKAHFHKQPNLAHLQILGSTMYVLLHEEERSIKSEKWVPRVLKRILVGYNRHTTYKVHIIEQENVIQVKNLRIFENHKAKKSTKLPDYSDNMPTF